MAARMMHEATDDVCPLALLQSGEDGIKKVKDYLLYIKSHRMDGELEPTIYSL